MTFGNRIPRYLGAFRSVIGKISRSPAGNIVLHVGRELHLGWRQTEAVVLTPQEARELAGQLLKHANDLDSDEDDAFETASAIARAHHAARAA